MLPWIKPPMIPQDNVPDLHPTQDANPHTIHTQINTMSTHMNKTHSPRANIMPSVTTFEQTKHIIMNIDALSHSTTLSNRILQSLYLNGLCKYDNLCKAYLFEYSNQPVFCSSILVFLKQSACYTVTPDTHQSYRTNTNKITDNHNTVLCNGPRINMVPLPTAELSESNAFETIARLTLSQNQMDLPNNNQIQAIPNTSILTNFNICNTPQNNMAQSHDQSTLILQQFSMITQELKKKPQIKCLMILQKLHRNTLQHKKIQKNS